MCSKILKIRRNSNLFFINEVNTTCYACGKILALALRIKTSNDMIYLAWQLNIKSKEDV
jgi:hypothetical protein